MSSIKSYPTANRLLASLPAKDREPILAGCESIHLHLSEVLYRPGERITHVYFPNDSFISLIGSVDGKDSLAVGLVGNEGMLGIPLLLGIDMSPLEAQVQGIGPALRMSARQFRRDLAKSSALQNCLKRYLHVLTILFAQSAVCNRFHQVEARLARWLLMSQDRAHADEFHVTQAFLAHMLGVRRVGITNAANALHDRDLIRYQRGQITVIDRIGLETASCACYQADRDAYQTILGES